MAILTVSRRLASESFFFASSSPSSIRFASSISSSELNNGILPISFKYIRTGSSVPTPSSRSIASRSTSSSSSEKSISLSKSSAAISSVAARRTSIFLRSRYVYTNSSSSGVRVSPAKKSFTSLKSSVLFLLRPISTNFVKRSFNTSFSMCIVLSVNNSHTVSMYAQVRLSFIHAIGFLLKHQTATCAIP